MSDAGRDNEDNKIGEEAGATDVNAPQTAAVPHTADTANAAEDAASPLSGLSKVLGGKPAAAAPAVEDVKEAKAAAKQKGGKGAGVDENKTPQLMPTGPLVSVVTRNEFYRDGFRKMINLAIFEAVIIVGLILTLIVYINNSKAQDRYFATTADGRIMQLVPLNLPNMSKAALLSWVSQAATDVMTFGYHDHIKQLQSASRHFTKTGWDSFTTALQRARIVDSVKQLQQVVTAVPRSAPVVLKEGIVGGRYRWQVQLPIAVTYKGATEGRTDNLLLTLVVERVSALENPNGVGIEQWIAEAK